MSLFEWLGETFNAGPVGDVDAGGQPLFGRSLKKGWVIFFMIIGLGILGFVIWLIIPSDDLFSSIVLFIFYLLLAYFLTPRPDTSNLGWAGGLINDPLSNFRRCQPARCVLLFVSFAG